MKSVAVLMSTYNGERYLQEQLDSILLQKNVNPIIVVRDDGSTDNTNEILKNYTQNHPNIIVLKEKNCGAVMSFHHLCQYALDNLKADYYAFCDQDDVWLEDKLQVAISHIEQFDTNSPSLYFSNLQLVDSQLNPMRMLYEKDDVSISKRMALIQIFTYGCTCVFNRSALEAYCQADYSKELCHDNWIYIVSMFLGNVYYDNNSYILYRQHGNNVSGEKVTGMKLLWQRLRRGFVSKWSHDFELYSSMLIQCFSGRLNPEDEKYVMRIANYRNSFISKLSLLFSPIYRTGTFAKDIAIKIRIITNHL